MWVSQNRKTKPWSTLALRDAIKQRNILRRTVQSNRVEYLALMVFWLSNKTAWKRVGGCRCSSGKAPRARPVACAGYGFDCVVGEAGAGAVVGGAAVVADERSDVGSNRVAAASAGDSDSVSGVLTGSEGRRWHACHRFDDVAVVKVTPLVGGGGSSGSATSPGRMT